MSRVTSGPGSVRYCYYCKINLSTNDEYNTHRKTLHPKEWSWFDELDDCPICPQEDATMLAADIGQHIEIRHKHWERVPDSVESDTLATLAKVTAKNYVLLGITVGLLAGVYVTVWVRSR